MKSPLRAEKLAFRTARARCQNSSHPDYPNYGGRGIEFRLNSVSELLDAIGPRPSRKRSLDRIDNDGHYEIGNLRWATMKEQSVNRRTNHWITVNGRRRLIDDWARSLGLKSYALCKRIARGWCEACAVTIPKRSGSCTHS